jgi:hypothetical protein
MSMEEKLRSMSILTKTCVALLTIAGWGLIPTIAILVTVEYGVNWPLLSLLFLEFIFVVFMWISLSRDPQ